MKWSRLVCVRRCSSEFLEMKSIHSLLQKRPCDNDQTVETVLPPDSAQIGSLTPHPARQLPSAAPVGFSLDQAGSQMGGRVEWGQSLGVWGLQFLRRWPSLPMCGHFLFSTGLALCLVLDRFLSACVGAGRSEHPGKGELNQLFFEIPNSSHHYSISGYLSKPAFST